MNSLSCIIFSDSLKKLGVIVVIFFLSGHPDNFETAYPIYSILYSTFCIVVLIPRLHQVFRKFGRISGSWGPSLIFFVKLVPCHPDNFEAAYPIILNIIFNILLSSINSQTASIFQKVPINIRVMAAILNFFRQIRTLTP